MWRVHISVWFNGESDIINDLLLFLVFCVVWSRYIFVFEWKYICQNVVKYCGGYLMNLKDKFEQNLGNVVAFSSSYTICISVWILRETCESWSDWQNVIACQKIDTVDSSSFNWTSKQLQPFTRDIISADVFQFGQCQEHLFGS